MAESKPQKQEEAAMAESKPQKQEEAAMAESKPQKQEEATMAESSDRISSLPDRLLLHILSFLSNKTSVQTSIMSPRWRHIWQHVSVLNLSDEDFVKFNDKFIQFNSQRFKHFRRFFYFVNSLIYVLRPYQVHKIRLSCTKSLTMNTMCSASINAWLHSAMGPLIKELDITLYTVHDFCFSLPQNISKCSNLVSLSLKGALSFKPQQPKSFSLPSLKTLGLDICGIDASSLNEFLQGCPCLETLDFYWYVEDCARICVPPLCLPSSLKSFKFVLRKHSSLSLSATQRLLEKQQQHPACNLQSPRRNLQQWPNLQSLVNFTVTLLSLF